MINEPSLPARSAPVDIARGLTVLCVVALHVAVGLEAGGLLTREHPWFAANEPLYLLRMPALALLIGLFIAGGVRKRGTRGYTVERLVELTYVYVLWSLILGGVGLATSGLQNRPTSLSDVLRLWVPQDHMWFLPLLGLMTAALVALRTWDGGRRLVLGLTVALAVTFLTWSRNADVVGAHGVSLLLFGAIGSSLTIGGLSALMARPRRLWGAVLAGSVLVFLALDRAGAVPGAEGEYGAAPATVLVSIVCALAGVVAVLAVSRLVADVRVVSPALAFAGRKTMPLFLMHLFFTAGTRIVLTQLGITDLTVHIVLGLLAGVAGPLVAAAVIERLGLHGLLALPSGARSWIRARLAPSAPRAVSV